MGDERDLGEKRTDREPAGTGHFGTNFENCLGPSYRLKPQNCGQKVLKNTLGSGRKLIFRTVRKACFHIDLPVNLQCHLKNYYIITQVILAF